MNRLADETSPYLRQHRDNPVDWYPWGDEAFAAARGRDVPILLSVGYSACHWCHVMAHECFEDDEVAAEMNRLFVNVKVDREERPDVDALYMDATQALTGRGGWPMTVFLTPAGEPFYAGTYFPKESFTKLLTAIDDAYRNKPDDIAQNATALTKAVSATANLTAGTDIPGVEQLNAALQTLARAYDRDHGGFGTAPKFPTAFNVELVLRAYMTNRSDDAKAIVETTLDAMASGGMYDHLGGGFARYSTDREWLVPHFEKMLYDQAMLLRLYLHGFAVFGKTSWALVMEETVAYVLSTLRHPDGGLYSAEDADSPGPDGVGVEGWFYTWTPDEVRDAMASIDDRLADPRAAAVVCEWFGITAEGNFATEGYGSRSIPNRMHARGELIRPAPLEAARRLMLRARNARPRPGLDDKVLTEWNALMVSVLAEGGAMLQRQPWLDAAMATAEFLLRELRSDDGRWFRSWHADGAPKARHMALAADHAALVDAFTRLAEATGEARWIDEAVRTAETMLDWFWDPAEGGLYTTAEDAPALIVRQKDLVDNATPSANSTAAGALHRLAALTGEQRYANMADRIYQLAAAKLAEQPTAFGNMLLNLETYRRGFTEVVITGDRPDLVKVAQTVWRPDVVLAWGERYDSPLWEGRSDGLAYICRDYTCAAPQDSVEGFTAQLLGRPPADGDAQNPTATQPPPVDSA